MGWILSSQNSFNIIPTFLNDLIFDTLYTSDPAMFSNSLFTLYRQQRAHITKRTKKCVHDPGWWKGLDRGNPSPWVWEKGYFWTNSPCFFVPNDAFYKGSLGGSYAKAWSKKVVVRVILVLWNCRKVLLDRPVPSSVLFHVGIWIMLQHSSSGAKKSEEMQKEEESPVSSSIGICVTQTTCCI